MDQKVLRVARRKLEEMVRGSTNRSSLVSEPFPHDEGDDAVAAAVQESVVITLNISARKVALATAALRRLNKGTYGACLECDKAMPKKRIKAAPEAEFCVSCLDEQEREKGSDKHFILEEGLA